MARDSTYLIAAVAVLLAACADGRDYEVAGYMQLNKGERFAITTRTPLLDDRLYNDLCFLPASPESLVRAEDFAFKTEDGHSFLPEATAVNEEGKLAPLTLASLRSTASGEVWLCLSPKPEEARGPYVQIRLVTPHKLRLASLHWHSYER